MKRRVLLVSTRDREKHVIVRRALCARSRSACLAHSSKPHAHPRGVRLRPRLRGEDTESHEGYTASPRTKRQAVNSAPRCSAYIHGGGVGNGQDGGARAGQEGPAHHLPPCRSAPPAVLPGRLVSAHQAVLCSRPVCPGLATQALSNAQSQAASLLREASTHPRSKSRPPYQPRSS